MVIVKWLSDGTVMEDVFDDVLFKEDQAWLEGNAWLYKNGVVEHRINTADIVEMYRIGGIK